MNKEVDEAVAARAYELWEKAGKPEGRDEEFWCLAEQELLNEDKSSPLRTPTRCDQPQRPHLP
ncbi:hypothetical protein CK489_02855 [Bradyrhizobium sp. UFLA03-84]|uniref:DUF2934 domain-containing protein n=1 Tax=Bradyrhizobium sp. UFLA03-84 TaxID=418599 RepID=UPI000BAE4D9F|nr:DUF2934 domain-containing protein [Bradyrhizobium sp. UFLA03-84]PAY09558.1 hypothetical protein CK489_02855 [Bradyrhizobium sp. UFLA03-84]